ncbi:MAG: hypothetical protein LUF90_07145 [Rikenellaceae bacterium]|nr:hypothetical protein [Rikenellaceae bacterium]
MSVTQLININYNNQWIYFLATPGDSIFVNIDGSATSNLFIDNIKFSGGDKFEINNQLAPVHYYKFSDLRDSFKKIHNYKLPYEEYFKSIATLIDNYTDSIKIYSHENNLLSPVENFLVREMKLTILRHAVYYNFPPNIVTMDSKERSAINENILNLIESPAINITDTENFISDIYPVILLHYGMKISSAFDFDEWGRDISEKPEGLYRDYIIFKALKDELSRGDMSSFQKNPDLEKFIRAEFLKESLKNEMAKITSGYGTISLNEINYIYNDLSIETINPDPDL